jgi:hypothetical protein
MMMFALVFLGGVVGVDVAGMRVCKNAARVQHVRYQIYLSIGPANNGSWRYVPLLAATDEPPVVCAAVLPLFMVVS